MEKQITISNFNLTYDGMYHLSWDKYNLRVFLKLSDLLKILKIEGYSIDEFDEQFPKKLLFTKTELLIDVNIENEKIVSFFTSDSSDCYTEYNKRLWLIEVRIK